MSISGKDITLQGAGVGQTIIESPDSAALVESYHESNSGLPYRYSVVTVKDNSDVTITGSRSTAATRATLPHLPAPTTSPAST